ncbi:DUF2384 domain-containing protein [Nocardioides cavernae]|uniref:DUF2384 domain-containing protein n=1 Tax=Nocardioides cavernae TaxID=1921566 RepID=A0ABR8N837_9ACTN|nr:antitoxin Xre/MbcA/ParS toxin-binding domain-containing protein [Nocardioides cavernae]MBD3924305.1 DUF2384 domain-containing protein [Nocardioides cavernae]MBM7510753.1 hypothetical protein [Nocardioides cavernae]
MADLVGPFYSAESVAARLDGDGACPSGMEGILALLSVDTADGTTLYPTFQFGTDGRVRSELNPLLRIVAGGPAWSAAVWLRTPNEQLDWLTPECAVANPDYRRVAEMLARAWLSRFHA